MWLGSGGGGNKLDPLDKAKFSFFFFLILSFNKLFSSIFTFRIYFVGYPLYT